MRSGLARDDLSSHVSSLVYLCPSKLSLQYDSIKVSVVQRNAGYEKAVPAKCRNGFSKNCSIVMPEIVKISLLILQI
jgi:hypothetical protein